LRSSLTNCRLRSAEETLLSDLARAKFIATAKALAVALAAALCCGCLLRHHHAHQAGGYPAPASGTNQPAAPIVQGEQGFASWYGHPYHGRPTSSGEIYNMYAMTAAHRTLPFGTRVRVHDLDNGQAVEVRINDRGPFVEGRIIDLSYAAAKSMGMLGAGIAKVQLEILNPALLSAPGIFAVQVGAFRERANADRLRDRIARRFQPVIIQSFDRGDGLYHRVRVGQESTEDAARELGRQLQQAGLATDVFVVRLN
jgi:rare lipoprotein A